MAYRKTEKVLAQLEAKRASIIAASIDVIAKSGLEGFTIEAVAARADVSVGLIFKYFPDKTELLAAVAAHLLQRDVAALGEAGSLENGILIFARRVAAAPRLMSEISRVPLYREGIKAEFERLLRRDGLSGRLAMPVAVVTGSIWEAGQCLTARNERNLCTALLRALSVRSKVSA